MTRAAENVKLGQLKVGLISKDKFDELKLNERAKAEAGSLRGAFGDALKRGHEAERIVSDVKKNYADLLADRGELLRLLEPAKIFHTAYSQVTAEIAVRDAALHAAREELSNVGRDSVQYVPWSNGIPPIPSDRSHFIRD